MTFVVEGLLLLWLAGNVVLLGWIGLERGMALSRGKVADFRRRAKAVRRSFRRPS